MRTNITYHAASLRNVLTAKSVLDATKWGPVSRIAEGWCRVGNPIQSSQAILGHWGASFSRQVTCLEQVLLLAWTFHAYKPGIAGSFAVISLFVYTSQLKITCMPNIMAGDVNAGVALEHVHRQACCWKLQST